MSIKSYRLINYLNQRHGRVSRFFFGSLAWLGSLAITFDLTLAKWSWRCFFIDEFKQGFRLCAWLARVRWPRLYILGDHFFDFTENADEQVLKSMAQFLLSTEDRRNINLVLIDQLYVLAAHIHCVIQSSSGDPSLVEPVIKQFYSKADDLLSSISQFSNSQVSANNQNRNGDFSSNHAHQALNDFLALFPRNQWRWYVVAGTFLGAYREGDFLAHDYDIDLGFNHGEVDGRAMLELLNQQPVFEVKKIDYQIKIIKDEAGFFKVKKFQAMFKIIHLNGINIDVYIHHFEDNMLWRGSATHRWINTRYELVEYDLADFVVLGPSKPELYLSESYGDWKTPVTHFDCSSDSYNLALANNFLSLSLSLKRLEFFARSDYQKYSKERAILIHSGVLRDCEGSLQMDSFL
jgi:hypothetical protein